MKASPSLARRQYIRLEKAIDAQIRQYNRFRKQLHNVDAATYAAGMSCFDSEAALAQWLCQPAPALGWKVPLMVMRTAMGRQKLSNLLTAIQHGVFL
jgi:uncharacterized protein (DUF2384 family)